MNIIFILLLCLLLFGGFGYGVHGGYVGGPYAYGGGFGLVLLVIVLLLFFR